MTDLLKDPLNLQLIESLIRGDGVEVNISSLSKTYKKHRNTIKMHLKDLIDHGIMNEPTYSLKWVFQKYPLLVIVRSDLPKTEEISRFVKEDMNIIGAFHVRNEEYNMLFLELHEDLYRYEEWRDRIVKERSIPSREKRYPANSLFFSSKKMIKYQPYSSISVIDRSYRKDHHLKINGLKMNSLSISILKKLLMGESIRTNENMLSKKYDIHRRTIKRRISTLMENDIISKPTSMFPKWLVPPDHILVYTLAEARKSKSHLIKEIVRDPHIPMALHANMGGYNMLLFGVFPNVESHFLWEEVYEKKFPGSFGRVKKIYLSPKMTSSLDIKKISHGILKKYSEDLKQKHPK